VKDLFGTELPDPPPMDAPLPWRIFQLDDYYWWVARTLEEACRTAKAEVDFGDDDLADARELEDEELGRLKFVDSDEDGNPEGEHRSFRQELARRVSSGLAAPELFACSEY
jgi:hypothetical protein